MNMQLRPYGCVAAILLCRLVTGACGETLSIENTAIRIDVDSQSGAITMRDRAANLYYVKAIHWPGNRALRAVRREDRESTTWGRGQCIVLQWSDHSQAIVTLYQGLPFAVIQDVVVNSDAADIRLNRRELATFDIAAGKPVDDCRAFGTFGLAPIRDDRNPGGYNHLAIVEPESRSGVVMAWLTHERASGVLFYDRVRGEDSVRVRARQDYGQLRLPPGDQASSETLLLGYFADARLGLEAYAEAARDYYKIQLPPQPSVYCTWYHAGASNERQIRQQTDFAAEHLKPFGFGVIQIDDKWQDGVSRDGPRRIFTRHRPDGPFPSGMKATADYIQSRGLTPGLWYMPFAATSYDPYYADRPQIFASKDGKPFEVRWGGTCLDLTNPDAQELVRARTQTICNDWGYRYLKTDGMWAGMATAIAYINEGYKEDNLGEASLANADMTHVEAYRTGLRIVRDSAGKEVFILGCNLAQNMRILGPSIGFVDAMRVGPDNKPTWSQMTRGPFSGSNLYFLHGRVWYNDPDPVYVRPQVPLHQARALLSWVTLCGQLHANSYYYADLPPERFNLLKRAIPSHGLLPRPVDLFDERTPRIWLLEDTRRAAPFYLLGLFNWDAEKSAHVDQSFKRIGLPPGDRYITFDYWDDKFGINEGDAVHTTLDAASCRILAMRPMAERPQLISTSRHITQGVVDVVSESWEADSKSLSGISRVVAGDPYELRIARPASGDWRLVETTVGEAVNASIKLVSEEVAGWRVRIDSPTSQELEWALGFE